MIDASQHIAPPRITVRRPASLRIAPQRNAPTIPLPRRRDGRKTIQLRRAARRVAPQRCSTQR